MNQPPYPGSSDQPPQQQPGYPPPPPSGQPNPYGQPTQPLWQGHQAPQQHSAQGGWHTQPAPTPPQSKKWLVPALAVLLLLLLGGGAVTAFVLAGDDSGVAVADLDAGDCIASADLAKAERDVSGIEQVDCDAGHHAEVFATLKMRAGESLDEAGTRCLGALDEAWTTERLAAEELVVHPLVAENDPSEGDEVVCFVRHADGAEMTGTTLE